MLLQQNLLTGSHASAGVLNSRVAFLASCVIQQKKVGDFYHFVPAEVINVYKSGKVCTNRRLGDQGSSGGHGSSNL